MKVSNESTQKCKNAYERQLAKLWPALKGSLAQVFKPCIRKNCPACARGDKHAAWILSYTDQGRRRCLYIPQSLVPLIQQGIENGRKLEQLLYRTGPALVKAHREQIAKNPGNKGE
jgi:hypothetical protein